MYVLSIDPIDVLAASNKNSLLYASSATSDTVNHAGKVH